MDWSIPKIPRILGRFGEFQQEKTHYFPLGPGPSHFASKRFQNQPLPEVVDAQFPRGSHVWSLQWSESKCHDPFESFFSKKHTSTFSIIFPLSEACFHRRFALENFGFCCRSRAGLFLAMLHRYNPKAYVERVRGLGIFGLCLSCCGLVPNGDELKWAKDDGALFSSAKWPANEKLLEGLVCTGPVFLGPRRTSWISQCFCLLTGRIFFK